MNVDLLIVIETTLTTVFSLNMLAAMYVFSLENSHQHTMGPKKRSNNNKKLRAQCFSQSLENFQSAQKGLMIRCQNAKGGKVDVFFDPSADLV